MDPLVKACLQHCVRQHVKEQVDRMDLLKNSLMDMRDNIADQDPNQRFDSLHELVIGFLENEEAALASFAVEYRALLGTHPKDNQKWSVGALVHSGGSGGHGNHGRSSRGSRSCSDHSLSGLGRHSTRIVISFWELRVSRGTSARGTTVGGG